MTEKYIVDSNNRTESVVNELEVFPFPILHGIAQEKVKVCSFYGRPSGCRSGDGCKYLHVPVDSVSLSQAEIQIQLSNSKRNEPCVFFARGRCKAGTKCAFLHGELPEVAFARYTSEPQNYQEDLSKEQSLETIGQKRKSRPVDATLLLDKYSMSSFVKKSASSKDA